MSELTGVERHLAAALQMLLRGVRPTVDLLVMECGGSRTTGQKALNELWEHRLPALLSAREYEDDVPVSVREAIGAVWREARVQADKQAQDAFLQAHATLDAQRAEMTAVLAGIEAERQQAREHVARLESQITDLVNEAAALRAEGVEQAECIKELRRECDALAEALAGQEAEANRLSLALAEAKRQAEQVAGEHASALRDAALQQERLRSEAEAERDAQRAAHQQAIDALKSAYVDSEARLRVDLDAARTELGQARKAAEQALRRHQEREAELAAEVATLKAARRGTAVRVVGRKVPMSGRKRIIS